MYVFLHVIQHSAGMNVVFNPSLILTDFEKTAMKVVSTIFRKLDCMDVDSTLARVGGAVSMNWVFQQHIKKRAHH